jgi:hypothetical protein
VIVKRRSREEREVMGWVATEEKLRVGAAKELLMSSTFNVPTKPEESGKTRGFDVTVVSVC